MKRTVLLMILALGAGTTLHAAARDQYDLVIENGTVMDPESGLNAVRNLGVRDGKIAAITTATLSGAKVIDAENRVVAPGFIDLHSHGQNLVGSRVQAFDGVTTTMENEIGQLPVTAAYAKAQNAGRAINYGYSVSWMLARMKVLAGATPDGSLAEATASLEKAASAVTARATPEQIEQILALLEQGLNEGASGIGLALGYVPAASEEEVFKVSQLAARRDVPVFVHTRSTVSPFAAVQEVIANAQSTGAHWYIMHFNRGAPAAYELLDQALQAHVHITPETLSWMTGSTYIGASFLKPAVLGKLGMTPADIVYYGRPLSSMDELAQLQQRDPRALIILKRPADDENVLANRQEVARRIASPGWVLASDTMPWQQFPTQSLPESTWPLPSQAWAHPRSASTYALAIQKYVREWRLVSLMDVIRAGSLNPAKALEHSVPQFRDKGRLKVGADADVIVFDPAQVTAVASAEHPAAVSTGMDYVIVNGVVLIDAGRLDPHVFPGRAVRRSQQLASMLQAPATDSVDPAKRSH
jgi:N-acyl-D-glutamate deacylase